VKAKRIASLAFLSLTVAVGALAAPAMASAVTIQGASSGNPIAVGAELTASGKLVFTLSTGVQLLCESNVIEGTVSANGGTSATVTVENGALTGGGALPGSCPSNIGAPVFWTTNLDEGATWALHLLGGGSWTLTNLQFTATFITGPNPGEQVSCTFRGAEEEEGGGIGMITGSYSEAPALTELFPENAGFTLVAGPAPLCGASGTLAGELETESEGEAIVVS